MAYTTVDDPSEYFQTTLYAGTGSGQSITNTGNSNLKPDWVWVKDRGATNDHKLTDSSRLNSSSQPTITIESNTTAVEYDDSGEGSDATTSFNTDGFTIGTNGNYNTDGNTYVAWQWKANGGTATGSFNESGNNPGVSFQANTTAGFSICTYTGTGGNGSFAHGLGVIPAMFIIKRRSGTEDWAVYHHKNTAAPETDHLLLNTTDATSDSNTRFQDTAPTNASIYIGNNAVVNADASTYVCYAFAPIKGYSAFGSYTGNGGNQFVYTGFAPAFLIEKRSSNSSTWTMYDNKRSPFNERNEVLHPEDNSAEETYSSAPDFLSNGFAPRGAINDSGETVIYMAFAESPFVSSEGIPTTAR